MSFLFEPCVLLASQPELAAQFLLRHLMLLPLLLHDKDGLRERLHDKDGLRERLHEWLITTRHTMAQRLRWHHGNRSSNTMTRRVSIARARHGLLVWARMQQGTKVTRKKWLPP